jgi:hypothetical protein
MPATLPAALRHGHRLLVAELMGQGVNDYRRLLAARPLGGKWQSNTR